MKRKPFHKGIALSEGWALCDESGEPSIRADEGSGVFGADGHAIAFVREKSDAGSAYHSDALRRAGLL